MIPRRPQAFRGGKPAVASAVGVEAVCAAVFSPKPCSEEDGSNVKEQNVISKRQEAEILRLHHAEKWPIGTIAGQLGLHHDAIERVLRQDGVPTPRTVRGSMGRAGK